MTKQLLCLSALVLSSACLTPASPRQATVKTTVAIGFAHQSQSQGWSSTVPERFSQTQSSTLERRNLVALPVSLTLDAAGADLTRARLAAMAAQVNASQRAPVVVLIETASRYDSQIVGRYRWTVFAKLTVADAGNLERATSRTVDVPITLEYDHQRDDAALAEASGPIARELGVVVDSFLASYGSGKAAPPGSAKTAPPAPEYNAIYFVMIDRFANGKPTNDGSDVDASDPAAWHGGDLSGLLANLDAISTLGIKTVWLSPLTKTRAAKFHGHGAFHGYWTENHGEIEPRFGTLTELEQLGREIESRGMGLYFDLVLNHVGPEAALEKQKPDWFHQTGPIEDWNDPDELQRHQVHGLPDLDQSNDEVYQYLLGAARKWSALPGFEGFRLDAVRHIAPAFWRRFNVDIREHKRDITLLGEVFDGNPAAIAGGFELGFDQLFDFPLHYAALESLCGEASYRELAAALGADRAYPDPSRLVTFADNHDTPRAASRCSTDRLHALYFFLLSVRGVPAITWGSEIGLDGATEPANRADMKFGVKSATRELIRERLALRHQHPALRSPRRELAAVDDDALIWRQQAGEQTAIVGISRSSTPRRLELSGEATIESGFRSCGPRCIELPPRAVGLAFVEAAPFGVMRRRVELVASGAPEGELLVVGNVPELGVWNAEKAARVVDGALTLELPVGQALAFKLAVRNGDSMTFEAGRNRTLWVERAAGPKKLELAWQK